MSETARRRFFNRAGLLAGGAMVALDAAVAQGATSNGMLASASFGWELRNLNGNGANSYFRVARNMLLRTVNIDLAFMITSLPASPGFAELLAQASVSRGALPTFDNSGGHAYLQTVPSPDFGSINIDNPNSIPANGNSAMAQDLFYSVILKAWVPSDGRASSPSRQVFAELSLVLNASDYLVFHMDHAGIPGDGEMQVVLNYEPL